MDQASPQCMDSDSSLVAYQQDESLPKVVVHFSVMPGATLTWRVEADSTLTVQGERLWLTRISSPYDYWLAPGGTFRLQRGERVWLSTDGERAARVSLTCALPTKGGVFRRWLGKLVWLRMGPLAPR
ncbi:hypothetical protein A6V36_11640 [Paraburkholderia ginsengiterrae]|uniref:DUF2917 domain-containing protein n=1 Tax=Paraburkholderia ginsengiterrae TaxID=1462993 RepID=A0A1A9N3K6_9BURK|nr:DUF2917 domain-containing protein [Paraburkholderia ginsengiterrae]OAJ53018.1 hypothetical protein A6V36_11640 [Paraburkholderia ginsengiterrae]OAJ55714.1 hypothetical protein A6V37_05705 [Paraburkholderia ginsengiterrae]